MWWMAIPAALAAAQSISSQQTANANTDADNIVGSANVYAKNLIRAANNGLSAAKASLARYNQSVNNNRVLQNTGSALEASTVNYRRQRDSATADNFEKKIQFAEQAGAQAAAGALSGLQGGVVDVVNSTTALRTSRINQRAMDAFKQGDYDASLREKQILQSGWDSLDNSEISTSLDYGNDIYTPKVANSNPLAGLLGGVNQSNTKSWANLLGSKSQVNYFGNTDAFNGGNKE